MNKWANKLTITLNNRVLPVNLIAKVYFSSPLYQGKLKSINEMTEELILCGKVSDHKYIKEFMVRWGCNAIMPEFLIPGFTYIGLGALLGHRDPVREDLTETLMNSLRRHPQEVVRALWSLSRASKEIEYYQNIWGYLRRFGVTFDQVRDTGLIVTTRHRVALWPDPLLKEALARVSSKEILWLALDNHLTATLRHL